MTQHHPSEQEASACSGVWAVRDGSTTETALFALHDAKNLALALGASIEWLEQACARGAHQELAPTVAEMARACRSLSDLLRGALRDPAPSFRSAPVRPVVDAARQRHAVRAERLNIRLQVEAPTELVGEFDATLLGRLLDNLLDNALRVAPADSDVTLFLGRDGDDLLVGVSDQGPGIPEGSQGEIFDLFVGGAGPASTGVGLAFCRHVADAHSGQLTVDSAPGEGATFVLRFPACRAAR